MRLLSIAFEYKTEKNIFHIKIKAEILEKLFLIIIRNLRY